MKSNLHPYIELCSLGEKLFKKHKFEITRLHADKTKEGWIRVYITWRAKLEEYKFKYVQMGGTMHSRSNKSMELQFPTITYKYSKKNDWLTNLSFEVGLQELKEKDLKYEPKFFENIKYGVLVWFAPDTWNDGKKDKEIFKWEKK